MSIGPVVRWVPPYDREYSAVSSEHTCIRCDYLKNNLIRSGRNPQWECECTHPKAHDSHLHDCGHIGELPVTPMWCPELKANKEVRRELNITKGNEA